MFLCRLQKFFICIERTSLRRVLNFRNGMKGVQQHVRFASNVQYPQNFVPDSFATDFTTIEKVWKQNQNNRIDDFLFQCFEKENDCFSYAVYLMVQACRSGGSSSVDLVCAVMRVLELWQKSNNSAFQQPTEQLQSEALMAALPSQNRFMVQLICDVFRINSQCGFIDDTIETCLSLRRYTEAAICAFTLKIQERYPVEKILLPLIMEGKMSLTVAYIGDNQDMLMKVVKSLDDSLHPQKQAAQKAKLVYKRLSALLATFRMPPETCPNFFEIRSRSTLSFLMHKRYSEKSITHSCWEEMTMALLRDSPSLHRKLIWKLVDVGDLGTAVKMASKCNIPVDEWPPVLKGFEENSELPDFPQNSEVPQRVAVKWSQMCENSSETEHLSLQLDKSCLKYIETAEQFEDCLNTISKNYEVVGFDSEWKPSFGIAKSRLALMQLAVEDKVYLLDFLALCACLKKSHWDGLAADLFGNRRILKLGCGLTADIDILVRNYGGTIGVPIKFLRLLDVGIFFQKFQFACPDIFPSEGGNHNINNTLGLSKICAYVLGSPLKKQQQFSNWEMRPLDDLQLHYAALDAYCLLQIYDKLHEVAEEKNLNFESIVNKSVRLTAESPKSAYEAKGRRMKWSKYDEGFEIQRVMSVREFKVLMDPKLGSLGKGLKNYGVDVTFLESSMECSDAITLAKAEERIILASSLLYEQLKALTSEGICHKISENFSDDHSSVAYVFQKFNVKFQAGDISYYDDVHSTS